MAYDLLIKGGTVVDPSQGLNAVRDVALSDRKVAAVAESIPESKAREVADATGLIVTPGLLDLHVHLYWGVSHYGIDPDVVGVIFDPANGIQEGFLRPRHAAEVLGPYLAYVHAKNLMVFYAGDLLAGPRRVKWESRVVPLECGMIDWVEVFFALNCVGFKGWLSVEEFFRGDVEAELSRGLAFLKECAAKAPTGPREPFTTFND